MVVFSVIFGNLMNVDSRGIPYPLFNYAALLPWTLFAEGISRAGNSLIEDRRLIEKVYFPRLIMPLAYVISPLIDFAIAFIGKTDNVSLSIFNAQVSIYPAWNSVNYLIGVFLGYLYGFITAFSISHNHLVFIAAVISPY